MNASHNDDSATPEKSAKTSSIPQEGRLKKWFKIFLCLVIVSGGLVAATYFNKTAPKARKRPPAQTVPLVDIVPLYPASHQVTVTAMGVVVPSREIKLKTRVAGEIVSTHPEFTLGGIIKKGAIVLKIDPSDYRLAVARKKSEVINGQYALELEMGHQDVAKREWDLLNKSRPIKTEKSALALRKPHLAKAKALLTAAEADLKQARLNLQRTVVRAPFNGLIRSKNVELGSQISGGEQLAELVGTDHYWVQAALPVDQLKWIRIPRTPGDTGAPGRILYQNGFGRNGMVLKLLGDMAPEGRMARLLISIPDPLDLESGSGQRPPLLIGEYVRVEIEGQSLSNIFRVPRSALRDNTHLWLLSERDRLDIRPVKTVWRSRETVLIRDGLAPGERLIVSGLSKPVTGMPLKIRTRNPPALLNPSKTETQGQTDEADSPK